MVRVPPEVHVVLDGERHARKRRQRLAGGAGGVDALGRREGELGRDLDECLDLGLARLNRLERRASNLNGREGPIAHTRGNLRRGQGVVALRHYSSPSPRIDGTRKFSPRVEAALPSAAASVRSRSGTQRIGAHDVGEVPDGVERGVHIGQVVGEHGLEHRHGIVEVVGHLGELVALERNPRVIGNAAHVFLGKWHGRPFRRSCRTIIRECADRPRRRGAGHATATCGRSDGRAGGASAAGALGGPGWSQPQRHNGRRPGRVAGPATRMPAAEPRRPAAAGGAAPAPTRVTAADSARFLTATARRGGAGRAQAALFYNGESAYGEGRQHMVTVAIVDDRVADAEALARLIGELPGTALPDGRPSRPRLLL